MGNKNKSKSTQSAGNSGNILNTAAGISDFATQDNDKQVSEITGIEEILNPEKLMSDALCFSYDDMLLRFENLMQLAQELPVGDSRHVAEELLIGAEELLLRQDETRTDFAIAIIALNEYAHRQILAVIRKSD